MKYNILFLSVNDLKENSVIDTNVEDKILESSILDAQSIDIQNIIGTKLYVKLLDLINTEEISLSGNTEYKTLLDEYIYPTHLKFSLLRSIMPMRVKFRNKGLMEQNSDNAQPVDKEFINYIENKIRNDVEFYSNKLKGYLCYFLNIYPEYDTTLPVNRFDYNYPNKKNSYFSGIYLGGRDFRSNGEDRDDR